MRASDGSKGAWGQMWANPITQPQPQSQPNPNRSPTPIAARPPPNPNLNLTVTARIHGPGADPNPNRCTANLSRCTAIVSFVTPLHVMHTLSIRCSVCMSSWLRYSTHFRSATIYVCMSILNMNAPGQARGFVTLANSHSPRISGSDVQNPQNPVT
jgi:hypothetical protein